MSNSNYLDMKCFNVISYCSRIATGFLLFYKELYYIELIGRYVILEERLDFLTIAIDG